MKLPGGLILHGTRHQKFSLKQPDGWLELALATQAKTNKYLPDKVSCVLLAALETIAETQPSKELIEQLCVADRQFLMYQLAIHLGVDQIWRSASCDSCQEKFDFEFALSSLPSTEAAETFPFTDIELRGRSVRFRVPNGADQRKICHLPVELATQPLVSLCQVSPDYSELGGYSAEELALIEEHLEAVSPGVITTVAASCPSCGQEQPIDLDPYLVLNEKRTNILDDVHTIAIAYHWREPDIFSLPKDRREYYLARIERERGMTT